MGVNKIQKNVEKRGVANDIHKYGTLILYRKYECLQSSLNNTKP